MQTSATLRDGPSAGHRGFAWSYASEDASLTDVVCGELLLMNTQYSIQGDSLAHVGSRFEADADGIAEAVFYNGFRAGEHVHAAREDPDTVAPWARFPGPCTGRLSIENLAEHGVQGCGVLIDLEHHLGRNRVARAMTS